MNKPLRFKARSKPNYGIDAPGVLRVLSAAGVALIAAGILIGPFEAGGFEISLVGPTLLALGVVSLGLGGSMLAYSVQGKFNVRDRMLNMVRWRGDEAVLDVGTGRGLLAVGAAKRLRSGTVTGIDIWQPSDLSGNSLENAQRNVEIEGVHDRVQLRGDDARDIGFIDNSFDVVLSLLCLHNIAPAQDREVACREIARVLKPRGIAIVGDYANVSDYARAFKAAGLKVEGPKSFLFDAFTALNVVVARKG